MGESTHTPLPWEFRTYAGGCTVVSRHDEPGTSVRARLKGVTVKVDAVINDDQSNAHEASPDARLIVKAPELLAVLKEITPDKCPIVTHHKPDCILCRSLRLITEIEGATDANPIPNR